MLNFILKEGDVMLSGTLNGYYESFKRIGLVTIKLNYLQDFIQSIPMFWRLL